MASTEVQSYDSEQELYAAKLAEIRRIMATVPVQRVSDDLPAITRNS